MKILITNDDGYKAQGLQALVDILRPYGELTVVAPKYQQSGMSLAISMGYRQIAVKKLSEAPRERWYYLDGTPSSCVKFGIDNILLGEARPDVVVSGINHGANAGTAALYSATVGAVEEAAINGIPGIAVSLNDWSLRCDFSAVAELFPPIFERLMDQPSPRRGLYYNINFPKLPASEIRGIRVGRMGWVHWEDEYQSFDPGIYARKGITKEEVGILYTPPTEEGEALYMMAGTMCDDPGNTPFSDHILLRDGYVSIVPHSIDITDGEECDRLSSLGFSTDFR